MKILTLLALFSGSVSAETIIRQNIPGLNVPDYTARSVIVDNDGQIYQSIPGMANVRDITQQSFYRDGNTFYPEAISGLRGSRDYSEPSYSIEFDQ